MYSPAFFQLDFVYRKFPSGPGLMGPARKSASVITPGTHIHLWVTFFLFSVKKWYSAKAAMSAFSARRYAFSFFILPGASRLSSSRLNKSSCDAFRTPTFLFAGQPTFFGLWITLTKGYFATIFSI